MRKGQIFEGDTELYLYGGTFLVSGALWITGKVRKKDDDGAWGSLAFLSGMLLFNEVYSRRNSQSQTTPEQLALMKRYNLTVPPTILK